MPWRAQAANTVISASPRFIVEAAGMILIISLAFWLSHRSGGLATALPILGALALGAQKLLPRMQTLYNGWAQISGNYAVLVDVLTLLAQPIPPEYLKATPGDSLHLTKQISLRNICFRYSNDAPEVIHNLSLEIPRGGRIGFVGKTGSGKSTLIDIILGLLDPTDGCIQIDGQTLCSKNRRSWQTRTAHVPQAVYLSDTSIAENIAFGIPPEKIDQQRVSFAAEKAHLSRFIETLPQQYQTLVGERGVRFVGWTMPAYRDSPCSL